jgi:hypothetical protein
MEWNGMEWNGMEWNRIEYLGNGGGRAGRRSLNEKNLKIFSFYSMSRCVPLILIQVEREKNGVM